MRQTFLLGLVFYSVTLLPAGTGEPHSKADYSKFEKGLSKDEQVLHALDRLAFGPRPGDVAAVKKLGLKKWIAEQLHPDQVAENPELERRLQPLESLRLSQADAFEKYRPAPRPRMPGQPAGAAAVLPPEPGRPLADLLTADQARIVRSGSNDARRALLASLPPVKIDELVENLPASTRNQLLPAANPELRRRLMLANNPQQAVAADLAEGKLYRAIYSNRQLEEVLTDFWYNHFNVDLNKGPERFVVPAYERDAIRPYVLGKFRDLLEATAGSPAMLFYLDNFQSIAPPQPQANSKAKQAPKQSTRGLNENYARELLELHTLGVDGGYTQQDIVEVARCFTGWSIDQPNRGGGFVFNERNHDKGEKHVLGVTIPAGGGKEDGEKVLDVLARHPSTAKFISRELAQRLSPTIRRRC